MPWRWAKDRASATGDSNLVDLGQRQRLRPQAVGQSFPLQKLHHQVIDAILRPDIVEMADIGVVHGRNGSGLTFHALFQFRRRRKMGGKDFYSDSTVKPGVFGAIHFAHAACPYGRLYFVRTKFCAIGKRHACAQL